ncbi:MAG: RDD family protein [Pseudobdellovibrionaceae bacterium]
MDNVYIPSTWRRLFAKGLDFLFRSIFYFPFIKYFFLLFFTEEEVTISLASLLVMFLMPAVYEFVFLLFMQATPGKWLFGLKVVPLRNSAGSLDWRQCVLRPLTERLTIFFSLSIYAFAFFRYDRTHIADWVAETRVVQVIPRLKRTKIRWFLGTLFVAVNLVEGVSSAAKMLSAVDWNKGQVELRSLLNVGFDEDDLID